MRALSPPFPEIGKGGDRVKHPTGFKTSIFIIVIKCRPCADTFPWSQGKEEDRVNQAINFNFTIQTNTLYLN